MAGLWSDDEAIFEAWEFVDRFNRRFDSHDDFKSRVPSDRREHTDWVLKTVSAARKDRRISDSHELVKRLKLASKEIQDTQAVDRRFATDPPPEPKPEPGGATGWIVFFLILLCFVVFLVTSSKQ
jgi:hypothetical protein